MRKFLAVNILLFLVILSSFVFLPSSFVYSAVPHLINYQGRLTDTSGVPLNGSYNLTFRIYDAESAGTLLWQGTYSVSIQKGIFNVLLGDISDSGYNFSNLAFDKPYFLEIKVGDEVMSPRQRITSSGYAVRAEEAEKLGGKQPNEYALASDITASPTANKAVKLDSNSKLPIGALKVYDSGWFSVSSNLNYTKAHNLGTTKVFIQVFFSSTPDGSSNVISLSWSSRDWTAVGDRQLGVCIYDLTNTSIAVRAGDNVADKYDSSGNLSWYTSGYYRIIMLALE